MIKHQSLDNSATVLTADADNPIGYGRIIRNNKGLLEKIVEHKDADKNELCIREINAGIYVFDCIVSEIQVSVFVAANKTSDPFKTTCVWYDSFSKLQFGGTK